MKSQVRENAEKTAGAPKDEIRPEAMEVEYGQEECIQNAPVTGQFIWNCSIVRWRD
jgi:hypothetical protein